MQKVLLSLRPLSCWHRQLGTVAQVQVDQPVRSLRALQQRQPPWLSQPSPCPSLSSAPQRLRVSAFGSLVRAGSLSHMHTNRLTSEESPYLLQHQHNPVHTRSYGQYSATVDVCCHCNICCCTAQVDWYPWGKEAFDKAVAEDKPIFLSVGYSTCHW